VTRLKITNNKVGARYYGFTVKIRMPWQNWRLNLIPSHYQVKFQKKVIQLLGLT
jgi:hypothetical protein